MTQKLLQIGSSAGVTIPKKSLKELGLKIGDEVRVNVDQEKRSVVIMSNKEMTPEDMRIAQLTKRFIERYRKDLEALARK